MARKATFKQQLKQRMQIQNAFNYIYEDPNRVITLFDLSDIACYSPFHFQRLYSGMTGETWSQTLCRSRLYIAAQRLISTTEKIGDIAYSAGFDTPVGFGKAFKKYFNQTPGQYRSELMGDIFIPGVANFSKRRNSIAPTAIVKLASQYVYVSRGYGCRAGRFDSAGLSAFRDLIEKYRDELLRGVTPSNWLGIIPSYRNFFAGENAEYIAAVSVPQGQVDKSSLNTLCLQQGDYAQFDHVGPLNEQTINSAINDWLPSSGYTLEQFRPILVDFGQLDLHQYLDRFARVSGNDLPYQQLGFSAKLMQNSTVKIYIPLRASGRLLQLDARNL